MASPLTVAPSGNVTFLGFPLELESEGLGADVAILGLPYGDQGLLLSRDLYRELGGFPPFPLMEDVALARRIGRRRFSALDVRAVTGAARYRCGGYVRRPLRNLGCLALYFMNCPLRLIARLYEL